MPFRLPALASAILFSFSTAALASDDASPSGVPAEATPSVQASPGSDASPVPEPETPFQVIAFAGLLLIWRNRRRAVLG
jgi:hypothetical protein